MPDDSTDDPDRAALEARIEQLEATVSRMLPGRRDILKAGAGAAVGAAGVYGATGGAAGQTGPAGKQGTDAEPNDMYAWDLDVANAMTVKDDPALLSVAASGSVTLSGGEGTVDTGESATDATYYLALGIDDPDADAKIAGRLFWDDSAGTYKVDIQETETSVGNPSVNYDVLRVR